MLISAPSTSTSTSTDLSIYIHQQKPLWNALVIGYTLSGYYGGFYLLFAANWGLNLLGVVLVTHALVLSAYLAHEFMHGSIFSSMKTNHLWGSVMQWLHGTSYTTFQDLAQGHIDHHIKGVDLYVLDRIALINQFPAPLQALIATLERLYFPALFLIRQCVGIWILYHDGETWQDKFRVVLVLLLRIAMFTAIGLVSLKALLLYFVAYIGTVHVVLLMDCLQHTYELYPYGSVVPKKDLSYEQSNTFSTPISRRYPWLNLLLLNFGYHNAHHAVMKCP
jgi:fatty acid desaturase